MNHFRAGVLVLTIVGERDGENFPARFTALQNNARIFHSQARTDVAVDPLHFRVFVGQAPFRHQIKNVGRPVLYGDILNLGALERDQLDHCAVQRGRVKLRRRAPFHVGNFRAFVRDDEGAFELAEILGVNPEICLQGMLHFHTRRDVDK